MRSSYAGGGAWYSSGSSASTSIGRKGICWGDREEMPQWGFYDAVSQSVVLKTDPPTEEVRAGPLVPARIHAAACAPACRWPLECGWSVGWALTAPVPPLGALLHASEHPPPPRARAPPCAAPGAPPEAAAVRARPTLRGRTWRARGSWRPTWSPLACSTPPRARRSGESAPRRRAAVLPPPLTARRFAVLATFNALAVEWIKSGARPRGRGPRPPSDLRRAQCWWQEGCRRRRPARPGGVPHVRLGALRGQRSGRRH